jgi:glycerol-3-phosphate acyltransferase PlsY
MDSALLGRFLLVIVAGYLIGSIPIGVLIGRIVRGIDVRDYGSGKMGGTNVMRTLGTKFGILVILLDVVKGAAAVLLAKALVGDSVLPIGGIVLHWQIAEIMAATAAVVGHNWPVFLKFRGGRGVATLLGTWLAIYPATGLFGLEIFVVTVILTQYMSMGSIFGAVASGFFVAPQTILEHLPVIYLVYGLLGAGLILYQHRDNISRLRRGTERRLGIRLKI